jgi:Domain of unknown function (DUF4276)
VFLLEEPSARHLLEGLLPKLVPADVTVHYLIFEGKQDLEKNIARKMRGWQAPRSMFVVLRDQDAADCRVVKAGLADRVKESGRSTNALVRVACRELEAWLLGDWQAVADAFDRPALANQSRKEEHRNPDKLSNPVGVLRQHIPGYQKGEGARRIGKLLVPERNQSPSFRTFCSGLARLIAQPL